MHVLHVPGERCWWWSCWFGALFNSFAFPPEKCHSPLFSRSRRRAKERKDHKGEKSDSFLAHHHQRQQQTATQSTVRGPSAAVAVAFMFYLFHQHEVHPDYSQSWISLHFPVILTTCTHFSSTAACNSPLLHWFSLSGSFVSLGVELFSLINSLKIISIIHPQPR